MTKGNWLGALLLRAERDGGGDGRKYSLVCAVTDEAGNSTSATACIVVPHDQRGNK